MVQTAKSVANASLAVSLFGVQQVINLLASSRARKAETAFYTVTETLESEFSSNPVIFAVNQIGNDVQRGAVDLAGDLLELKQFDPAWRTRIWDTAVQASKRAARALTPGSEFEATVGQLRNSFQ